MIDLIGPLELIVKVLMYGKAKYSEKGWMTVEKERYIDAHSRHMAAYYKGEHMDEESGLPHLAHALCSLMFVTYLEYFND